MHVRMPAWRPSRSLEGSGLLGHRGCRNAGQIANPNSELEKLRKEIEPKDKYIAELHVRAAAQHTRCPRTFALAAGQAGRRLESVAAVRFRHAPRRRTRRRSGKASVRISRTRCLSNEDTSTDPLALTLPHVRPRCRWLQPAVRSTGGRRRSTPVSRMQHAARPVARSARPRRTAASACTCTCELCAGRAGSWRRDCWAIGGVGLLCSAPSWKAS